VAVVEEAQYRASASIFAGSSRFWRAGGSTKTGMGLPQDAAVQGKAWAIMPIALLVDRRR
jgi:hypothetical protein